MWQKELFRAIVCINVYSVIHWDVVWTFFLLCELWFVSTAFVFVDLQWLETWLSKRLHRLHEETLCCFLGREKRRREELLQPRHTRNFSVPVEASKHQADLTLAWSESWNFHNLTEHFMSLSFLVFKQCVTHRTHSGLLQHLRYDKTLPILITFCPFPNAYSFSSQPPAGFIPLPEGQRSLQALTTSVLVWWRRCCWMWKSLLGFVSVWCWATADVIGAHAVLCPGSLLFHW